jgi:hypothetical protein
MQQTCKVYYQQRNQHQREKMMGRTRRHVFYLLWNKSYWHGRKAAQDQHADTAYYQRNEYQVQQDVIPDLNRHLY